MKVQVTRQVRGFGGVTQEETVVLDLPDGSELPEGAVLVPDPEENN